MKKYDYDWLKALLLLKLKIRIVLVAAPPKNFLCKSYSLKVVDVYQKQIHSFCNFYSFYEKDRRDFWKKLT